MEPHQRAVLVALEQSRRDRGDGLLLASGADGRNNPLIACSRARVRIGLEVVAYGS